MALVGRIVHLLNINQNYRDFPSNIHSERSWIRSSIYLGIIANNVAVIPSVSNPIAENKEAEERKVVTRIRRGSLKRENVCRPKVENREEEEDARDHEVRSSASTYPRVE